jgi:hypothetical protein
MKEFLWFGLLAATASVALANDSRISGDYLEVRSCDVYTGSCVANGEMGLAGKEAILVWTIREGGWNGASLDGLSAIAVVRTDATLGNVRYEPREGKAVLILDSKANSFQRQALTDFVRTMGGPLISEVAEVKTSTIESTVGACAKSACASVKASELVEISTRCFGEKDHLCGNEETFYPPLTDIVHARPAFTEVASYSGTGLNLTWQSVGQRSAFLGSFVR